MNNTPDSSNRRKWPFASTCIIALLAIAALVFWCVRCRQSDVPEFSPATAKATGAAGQNNSSPVSKTILIYIPPEGAPEFPQGSALAVLNHAGKLWNELPDSGNVIILSLKRMRGLRAKVIMHSYGIGPARVRIADKAEDIGAAGEIIISPEVPPEVRDMLLAQRISLTEMKPEPLSALPAPEKVKNVAIVLGNEPLDGSTPTVDHIKRTLKAVEFFKNNPGSFLVFTGGPTAGGISEAGMMALIALSRGVPRAGFRLEEKARTTGENARLSAKIIAAMKPENVYIISKADHLDWAMPIFHKVPGFKNAKRLPCKVSRAGIISQMEEFLKVTGSRRVLERLKNLRAGRQGTD
ncbi:MAG: YdcF family protein [Planctomycetota bacterium]|jgi:hypothetical protein